jgi:hypothetical protein
LAKARRALAGAPSIPLTFDLSKSDVFQLTQNMPIYAAVTGQTGQAASGNVVIYWCDQFGNPTPVKIADNTQPANNVQGECNYSNNVTNQIISPNYTLPHLATGWADYSFQLNAPTAPASNAGPAVYSQFDLANLTKGIKGLGPGLLAFSGRIWVSIGPLKLPFVVGSPSSLTTPALTGNPGQYCLFDWIEFSWDGATFNGNTTQVNQFGFSLVLEGNGGAPQGVLKPNASRPTIVSNFVTGQTPIFGQGNVINVNSAASSPYASPTPTPTPPLLYPPNIGSLRVLPPITVTPLGTGANSNVQALNTYFNGTIANLYSTLVTTPIVIKYNATEVWTGLVLTYMSQAPAPGGPAPAPQPGTPGVPPGPSGTTALAFYRGNFASLAAFQTAVQLSQNPVAAGNTPGVPSMTNMPMFWIMSPIQGNGGLPPPTPSGWVTMSSYDVWQCSGSLANPNTVTGNWTVSTLTGEQISLGIQNALASALNRGVLNPTPPSAGYYLYDMTNCPVPPAIPPYYPIGTPSNTWAMQWHQYNQNGLAYGFPYDDNCGQNPSISVTASSITITLGNFYS